MNFNHHINKIDHSKTTAVKTYNSPSEHETRLHEFAPSQMKRYPAS